MDDIIITGNSSKEIDKVVHQLHNMFSLKNMRDLHFSLGIDVHHMSHGLYLTQKKYVLELLHKASMDEASPTLAPMVGTPKFTTKDGNPFPNGHLYRSIIRTLQYVCIT